MKKELGKFKAIEITIDNQWTISESDRNVFILDWENILEFWKLKKELGIYYVYEVDTEKTYKITGFQKITDNTWAIISEFDKKDKPIVTESYFGKYSGYFLYKCSIDFLRDSKAISWQEIKRELLGE